MRWYYSDRHHGHNPEKEIWAGVPSPSTEVATRADVIAAHLRADPTFEECSISEHGIAPIEAVHDPRMVAWLEGAWEECRPFSETREIFPDSIRHVGLAEGLGIQPEPLGSPLGRLGYWCFDTMTPLVEGTYDAARASVDVALSAMDDYLGSGASTYALCRPPGHHAAVQMMGGFCFFNNAAIVAQQLIERGAARVGILDVDVHHGNGTQQIFYDRSDVVYVSLHGDPERSFPYFTGWENENGIGEGTGFNCNVPLSTGCTDADYLTLLADALAFQRDCGIEHLVVSLGVDTYALDPLSDLAITREGFHAIGSMINASFPSCIVIQEGGYDQEDLAYNVQSFLRGVSGLGPDVPPDMRDPSIVQKQHL